MPTTAAEPGSAKRWRPVWGARADDWAINEEQQLPAYEEALRRVGVHAGERVLDIACGTGVFLRLAADAGAEAFGIDASQALLEIARRRVPGADLRLGDMQFLPYPDDGLMKAIARPFFPPRPADAGPPPPPLWQGGVLEELATAAGLTPQIAFDLTFALEYRDEETLGRLLMAPAGLAELVGPDREALVRAQIVDGLSEHPHARRRLLPAQRIPLPRRDRAVAPCTCPYDRGVMSERTHHAPAQRLPSGSITAVRPHQRRSDHSRLSSDDRDRLPRRASRSRFRCGMRRRHGPATLHAGFAAR